MIKFKEKFIFFKLKINNKSIKTLSISNVIYNYYRTLYRQKKLNYC